MCVCTLLGVTVFNSNMFGQVNTGHRATVIKESDVKLMSTVEEGDR